MSFIGCRLGYFLLFFSSTFLFSLSAAASEGTCVPSATNLCLLSNQFGVTVDWTSASSQGSGGAQAAAGNTGFFLYDDPGAAEAMVKIVDGCSVNNQYWVFIARVSDYGQTVTVTSFGSGDSKDYISPLGQVPAPILDTAAFTCAEPIREPRMPNRSTGSDLLLAAGRFRVGVDWTDFAGSTGTGTPVHATDRSGAFSFFTVEDLEMLVKIAPDIESGVFSFSFSGVTNVAWDLTLEDTWCGQSLSFGNPLGNTASGTFATAFPIVCASIFADGFESGDLNAWSPIPTAATIDASEAVDNRIAQADPATAKLIFQTQDHAAIPPVYVRNTGNWAADLDLTAISPWNSNLAHRQAGTLISPRHIIFAAHYPIPIGTTIRFIDAQNQVVERTMVDRRIHPDSSGSSFFPDLAVGILDSDVPDSISFAKVLPDDWRDYVSNERGLPALCLDQEEKALIADLLSEGDRTVFVYPDDPQRLEFSEALISGDSGNPAFLIFDQELVLLTVWTFGGPGSGTSIFHHKADINAMMTDLGTAYQLTEFDMSIYSSTPLGAAVSFRSTVDPSIQYPFLGDLQ